MNVFSTLFNNKSKACVCKDAKCSFMCYLTRQAQKVHLSRLHRAPCPNISENSGKHFILQGRRLMETDKISKSLMLPAAKIASQ